MNAARVLPMAALAATALLLAAMFYYEANPEGYWSWVFARDTFYHVFVGAMLAGALRIWNRDNAALALAAVSVVYVAGGVGILPSLSALLFVSACLLLGRRLLAFMFPAQVITATAAMICGLAVYLTVFGLMIHFPVNYRAVYVLLICIPVAAEARAGRLPLLPQQFHDGAEQVRAAAERIPYWLFATAVVAGLLIARLTFLPSIGFDDYALHLRLWSQLRYEHQFAFDFLSQIWEVAPFLVDLLHASVSLVAGADSRGATNLLLLSILLRQMWVILGALQLDAGKRLLVLALVLSTPLTSDLLLSQQTELFMAVMTVTAVRLILELRGNWCSPHMAALLAIAALCCATKLPGAVLGLALLTPATLRLWSMRNEAERPAARSVLLLGAFTAGLALLAFNSYVTAWLKTGNPVFPLYNAIFKSPYFEPNNFADTRWIKGYSPATYWDLFFNTSGYSESRNFVAGFQYLLLLPLALVTLLTMRSLRQYAVPLLVPLLGFGLIMFASTQYWRYEFPVLPLAAVVIGALLVPQYSRRGAVLVKGSLLVCIVLNVVFYPGISSFLLEAPGRMWTASGKQRVREYFVPAGVLTEWINDNAPGSRVLYPEGIPYGATLYGTPVYVNWYSPTNAAAFYAVRNEDEGMAFLRDRQIDYIIAYMNDPGLPGTRAWALRSFLARVGVPLMQLNDHILYRFDGGDVPYEPNYAFEQGMAVDATTRMLGSITTGSATAMRYRAEFSCIDDAGYLAAQINWNNGQFYYHRIECSSEVMQFAEGVPIPPGATGGGLYVAVSETTAATLNRVSIETLE